MMQIEINKNREYYSSNPSVCQCDACQYYVKAISNYCPELTDYLETIGVDITLPFETMWIVDYDNNQLFFTEVQYVVFGKCDINWTDVAGSHIIFVSKDHPSTNIDEEHFVIGISGIHLSWVNNSKLEDVFALSGKKRLSIFRRRRNNETTK